MNVRRFGCNVTNHNAHRKPLGVAYWKYNSYEQMTSLIQLQDIISHVVLTEATICGTKHWVTIMLNKVRKDSYDS